MESRNIMLARNDTRLHIIQLYHGAKLRVTEISDGYGYHHEYIAEVLSAISAEIFDGFYIIESKMNYLDNRQIGGTFNR